MSQEIDLSTDDGLVTVKANAGLSIRAGAKAAVTVNMTNANADLTYTAKDNGYPGNEIVVLHADPDVVNATLSVVVKGRAIIVNLATNGAKAITSTATLVAAAIVASAAASDLVTVAVEGTGAGVVNAMSWVMLAGGVDGLALTKGQELRVISFDATNVKVMAVVSHDEEWHKATDVETTTVAKLVTACTSPA